MIYVWICLTFLCLYLLATYLIHLFQKKFLFFPAKLKRDYKFNFEQEYEEIWINRTSRYELNGLLFKSKKPKGCVLYHHGNSKNIQHWAQFAINFTSRGYDVLFYDYRGFGKSTGVLKEQTLYKDSRKFYKYLKERYEEDKIIQYGRSLGTALATRLARKQTCPLLILETPYFSMQEMANIKMPLLPVNLILNFKLRQDLDIVKVKCPTTIISGTDDELTPHEHSIRLQALKPGSDLVIIPGGTHNGLPEFKQYQDTLDKLLGPKL